MAPTAQNRRHAQSSQINIKEVAERQAATLVDYIKKFTICQDVLRTDPTKMKEMLAAHAASPDPNVVKQPNPYHFKGEEVDHLLEQYNSALGQEPVTYEDVFAHYHYAFSASLLYNTHKVAPHFEKWRSFKDIFDRRFGELQSAFVRDRYPRTVAPPPLSSVLPMVSSAVSAVDLAETRVDDLLGRRAVSAVNLTKTRADDLLRTPFSLVDQDFVNMPGTEDACQWKVITVTMNANKQFEYGIQFSDCDCPLPMEQNEIINLMMDSRLVNK